ncbi:UV DNA damage repair endonuclease UvsE [Irregularibacter muris]|uniref:UV DNA damage repair endonuclease UvsE n=1 Tax=Irregularibacter muris TaxID=1796619 RepID=A0AAE3HDK9_9FIRM|nr:UV DNA damage repair endonuclease UvsE [Irregularibacter muris]MCR1897384.1 UV DNA damage repair endonuclease UvsE [Irregularibacter muris]
MRVRLGYVAIALELPKVTSSSNVTYTYYQKLNTEEKRLDKLKQISYSNTQDLKKILEYNIEREIHFYRITSALIPLATHPEVKWNYRELFKADFKQIGQLIKNNHMRVDTHPDQFNVINSTNENVVESTKRNLWFHAHLFEDMEYPQGKMVLHVGSAAGGKEAALKRFKENFRKYPKEITSKIILENDDKTFTAKETLRLCKELRVPMVLDVHHHICNNDGEHVMELLPEILDTWKGDTFPPKIHFSSPKESSKDRKHADFINGQHFVEFIENCKRLNQDIDIMIEAKKKDLALYHLAQSIKNLRKEWNWLDNSTFEI